MNGTSNRVPDALSGHHTKSNGQMAQKKEGYKRNAPPPDMWYSSTKQLKTKSEKVLAEARAEAEAIRAAEVKKAEESDTETPVE